jgi:hypothetical protein
MPPHGVLSQIAFSQVCAFFSPFPVSVWDFRQSKRRTRSALPIKLTTFQQANALGVSEEWELVFHYYYGYTLYELKEYQRAKREFILCLQSGSSGPEARLRYLMLAATSRELWRPLTKLDTHGYRSRGLVFELCRNPLLLLIVPLGSDDSHLSREASSQKQQRENPPCGSTEHGRSIGPTCQLT